MVGRTVRHLGTLRQARCCHASEFVTVFVVLKLCHTIIYSLHLQWSLEMQPCSTVGYNAGFSWDIPCVYNYLRSMTALQQACYLRVIWCISTQWHTILDLLDGGCFIASAQVCRFAWTPKTSHTPFKRHSITEMKHSIGARAHDAVQQEQHMIWLSWHVCLQDLCIPKA